MEISSIFNCVVVLLALDSQQIEATCQALLAQIPKVLTDIFTAGPLKLSTYPSHMSWKCISK